MTNREIGEILLLNSDFCSQGTASIPIMGIGIPEAFHSLGIQFHFPFSPDLW